MDRAKRSARAHASASGTAGEPLGTTTTKNKKDKKSFFFWFYASGKRWLKENVSLQLEARAQQVRIRPNIGWLIQPPWTSEPQSGHESEA